MIEITPEAMARYRATVRRRQQARAAARAERRARAWEVARQAASFLTREFGAARVIVFGSLAHGRQFTEQSDIDLAAVGLRAEDYLIAVARLQDLSTEFSIDLVAWERCRPELRAIIDAEGIEI